MMCNPVMTIHDLIQEVLKNDQKLDPDGNPYDSSEIISGSGSGDTLHWLVQYSTRNKDGSISMRSFWEKAE